MGPQIDAADAREPDPSSHPRPAVDRRRFLTTLAGGAATAFAAPSLLAACASPSATPSASPASAPGTTAGATAGTTLAAARGGSLLDGPAALSPVKHVVVLMMENRSFDHWLGWLGTDQAWLDAGRSRYGGDFTVEAKLDQTFAGATGPVATAHMLERLGGENPWRGCGHPDPGHSWNAGRAQRDNGFLATGSGNDAFAASYYLGSDLPFTAALARRFTVCDHSFASVLGPTFPNREYLLAAQSGGNKTNALPNLSEGFAWDTIIDRLDQAGVSVRNYYVDLPVAGLWGPRMLPHLRKIEEFFTDCAAGTLPSVSFVDPGFTTGARTDNHPHGDIRAGEKYARDAFAAFARSPHWQEGVFVLTYDEWGGFFDHVKPPVLPDDRPSATDLENFGQAGFRVPTVVASPFARAGFVDHRQYDHTSILRFLEWRFLGAPPEGPGGDPGWSLTARDRNANNLGASLVAEPDKDLGMNLDVAVDLPSPDCAGTAESISYAPTEGDKHSFEVARDEGWFDRIGVDTEPSPMARQWTTA